VQALSSLQTTAVPGAQSPEPSHRSPAVHALWSEQVTLVAAKASVGHCVALPVQFSATSQPPAAARQVTDEGW